MLKYIKILIIIVLFSSLNQSITSASINDDQFKKLLTNDNIEEAKELYKNSGNNNWSFWIAQKYLSLNDIDSAIEWYTVSSDEGNNFSMFQMAEVIHHLTSDQNKSLELFYQIEKNDNDFLAAYSKFYISRFHRYGWGIIANQDRAFQYVKEASNMDLIIAKFELIDYYLNGIGTKIDNNKAARMMFEFADEGYTEAEHDYAIMILNEIGVSRDEETALLWLERSAQKAYPPALQKLSSMYFYGEGVKKDDVKAYEYYLLAKQLGVSDIELDMNMNVVSPDKKEIAVENYSNFRPRMNKNSITYLRLPEFMK
jgi:TPR repeat protein